MAPPKKASATSSSTPSSPTSSFFKRGKKSTTTQRIIAAKSSVSTKAKPTLNTKTSPSAPSVASTSSPSRSGHQKTESLTRSNKQTIRSEDIDHYFTDEPRDSLVDEVVSEDSWDDVVDDKKPTPVQPVKDTTKNTRRPLPSVSLDVKQLFTVVTTSNKATKKRASSFSNLTLDTSSVCTSPTSIHQEQISEPEKKLRQFDLLSKYGPCLDLTRLERWERAFALGLEPPQSIKDLLLKNKNLNVPVFSGRV